MKSTKLFFILCLCALLPVLYASAQSSQPRVLRMNTAYQFLGKWQEYKRSTDNRRNKTISISTTDTLKYDFRDDSTVYCYQYDKTNLLRYHVSKNGELTIGDKLVYKKMVYDKDELQLGTGDNVSYFQRVKDFYLAPIKKIIPKVEIGNISKLDASFLQGKWKVYKKTDPNFNAKNTYLHSLEIKAIKEENIYTVHARVNTMDKIISNDGELKIADKILTLKIMNQTKNYTILEAVGNELVLQDGKVVYYFTNLSR